MQEAYYKNPYYADGTHLPFGIARQMRIRCGGRRQGIEHIFYANSASSAKSVD
jgi:hypothetical protein